jgi:DNA-binding NtrC family response regulator
MDLAFAAPVGIELFDVAKLAGFDACCVEQEPQMTGGHKAKAAKILGLDRRTLYRKVAELAQREGDGEPTE